MVARELRIANRLGLHARAAARFVHAACGYRSRIRLQKDGREVDGKSILGILTLAAVHGAVLHLTCEGEDELSAADGLQDLVERHFGEDP